MGEKTVVEGAEVVKEVGGDTTVTGELVVGGTTALSSFESSCPKLILTIWLLLPDKPSLVCVCGIATLETKSDLLRALGRKGTPRRVLPVQSCAI